jgi:hypothetical protein
MNRNIAARFSQRLDDGPADAPGAAGDQCHSSCEFQNATPEWVVAR